MFEEEFNKLTKSEQNQFRKAISDLLFHCYIVRRVFDKVIKTNKINPDYLFIEQHYDLLADYLSFMGVELSKDDDNGVIFIVSEDEYNRLRIDGVTTLILYALRSYYEDKIKDNPSSNEVLLDTTGLKVLLKDLGLMTVSRRFSTQTLSTSLRTLANFNVVCLFKGSFSEAYCSFYILPTIRYVISNAKLNALYNAIQDASGEESGKSELETLSENGGDDAESGEEVSQEPQEEETKGDNQL